MGGSENSRKPVGETLDARRFPRSEGAILRGVDEHEPVLAEMCNDGAARFAAALASVAVLEAGLVVGELKLHATPHRLSRVLAFAKQEEITQVAVAVWTRPVSGQVFGATDFEHVEQVTSRDFAPPREMSASPIHVVIEAFVASTRRETW